MTTEIIKENMNNIHELAKIKNLAEDIVNNQYAGTPITHAGIQYVTMYKDKQTNNIKGIFGDYRSLEGALFVVELHYRNQTAVFKRIIEI